MHLASLKRNLYTALSHVIPPRLKIRNPLRSCRASTQGHIYKQRQLLTYIAINLFSLEWQQTLLLTETSLPIPLTSMGQMGTRCQKRYHIGTKQTMYRSAREKDPREAPSSSLNASAFAVITCRDSRLELLTNTTVQGKESQAMSLCSLDWYTAPLHMPTSAKTIVI